MIKFERYNKENLMGKLRIQRNEIERESLGKQVMKSPELMVSSIRICSAVDLGSVDKIRGQVG